MRGASPLSLLNSPLPAGERLDSELHQAGKGDKGGKGFRTTAPRMMTSRNQIVLPCFGQRAIILLALGIRLMVGQQTLNLLI